MFLSLKQKYFTFSKFRNYIMITLNSTRSESLNEAVIDIILPDVKEDEILVGKIL